MQQTTKNMQRNTYYHHNSKHMYKNTHDIGPSKNSETLISGTQKPETETWRGVVACWWVGTCGTPAYVFFPLCLSISCSLSDFLFHGSSFFLGPFQLFICFIVFIIIYIIIDIIRVNELTWYSCDNPEKNMYIRIYRMLRRQNATQRMRCFPCHKQSADMTQKKGLIKDTAQQTDE